MNGKPSSAHVDSTACRARVRLPGQSVQCLAFLASVLALALGCTARGAPARSANGESGNGDKDDGEYSLTRKSSSTPERQGNAQPQPSPLESRSSSLEQECDARDCEGTLDEVAVKELRATAAHAEECYERELKDNAQLEGKLTVLVRLPGPSAKVPGACPARIEGRGEGRGFAASEAFKTCLVELFRNTKARAAEGCVDVALPLSFVRKEVEAAPPVEPAPKDGPSSDGKTTPPRK
ncbi:MAG: hypothetical protein QM784_28620 [Polyangiaceae bacterium]